MSKTRKVLLALLGLSVLSHPVALLLAAMLPDASVNPVPQCIGGMLATILLVGVPAWLLRPWTSIRLPQKKSDWPGVGLAVIAGLLTRAAMSPVDTAWQGWLGLAPDALPVPETLPVAMLYIMALVVVPAVAEEAFFRGALLTGLLEGGRRITATVLTTAAFALMHGSAANLPGLLAISLVLTLMMLHTGRITAAVTAHFFYNISALLWTSIPGWGSLLCGALLIGMMAYMIAHQPKMAHPPMRAADGLIAAGAIAVLVTLYLI